MTGLDYVSLDNTRLSGPLPETLANLDVGRFYFRNTGLCLPRSLAEWYAGRDDPSDDPLPCIPEDRGPGCARQPLSQDRGPDWQRKGNWLTDKSLNTWFGIVTDAEGYVTEVFLPWNNLTDSIPPELGNLSRLEVLALYGNELTGRDSPGTRQADQGPRFLAVRQQTGRTDPARNRQHGERRHHVPLRKRPVGADPRRVRQPRESRAPGALRERPERAAAGGIRQAQETEVDVAGRQQVRRGRCRRSWEI